MELRLQYWRKRRALSIEDLSALAKVSTSTIVQIEKTGYMPKRPSVIRKLATALNVTVDQLLIDPDEKATEETAGDEAAPKQLAQVA